MKKINKIVASLILIMTILFCLTTSVFAVIYETKIQKYVDGTKLTDEEALRNEINKLSKSDLETLELELQDLIQEKQMSSAAGIQAQATILLKVKQWVSDRRAVVNSEEEENKGKGKTDEELKQLGANDLMRWINNHDTSTLSQDVRENWIEKINNKIGMSKEEKEHWIKRINGMSREEAEKAEERGDKYTNPSVIVPDDSSSSLDDMIIDGESFLDYGTDSKIDNGKLQNFSATLFDIFIQVGIVVAVICGLVIGIRFMLAGTEEKAQIKEMLLPYIIGCIVVFGAFGIWKLVVEILRVI